MLSGKKLFAADTVPETLAWVMTREPVIPDAPAHVRNLLRRCLEKDPRRRLQAIGEARIILEGGEPQITTKTPRHQERPWFSLVSWCLGGGIAVFAAVLAFIHFRETPAPVQALRYSIPAPEKTTIDTFAISPDGRHLAIAAAAEGKRQLWVRPLDAMQAQLLPGTDDARSPFWSPDSGWIGFFATPRAGAAPGTATG